MSQYQSENKTCQNCKKGFIIEPEDFEFYEKISSHTKFSVGQKVSPPKYCFYCRTQKRLAFWPFGKFNKRLCDLSKEKIISIFSSSPNFPVYKTSNWNSDKWEVSGMEYNATRPFFEQFYELFIKAPKPHQFGINNVECDYCDDVWDSKNCYLCRSLADCENLSYSYRTLRCRDSYDLTYCYDGEKSYDCTYCFKTYNVKYALNVRDSIDSAFLYDCRNVNYCFMRWNLRNKDYHILNQPYSKEEYFKKIKEYNLKSWNTVQFLRKEFEKKLKEEAIHKVNFNTKSVESSGNYLSECKKCRHAYFLENSENCAYYFRGVKNKDVYDSTGIYKGELIYDVNQFTRGYNVKHSNYCTNCSDSEYLDSCVNCQNCFGCASLKNKNYCILNKQYGKEDYEKLVAEIKKSMEQDGSYGEFFPYKMAYGGYNLSLTGFLFPKNKEEVEKMNGLWEELEKTEIGGMGTSLFIDDVSNANEETVKNKVFICEETGRPFNIRKEELEFLKSQSIPLPHHYPDVRNINRMKLIFNIIPYQIKCSCCGKNVASYYPREWGYKKIYCEDCYIKEIV